MTQVAIAEQYAMAHDIAALITRTSAALRAAEAAKNEKAAGALEQLEFGAAFLLDIIDGVDAPPTSQARASYCEMLSQAPAAVRVAHPTPALCAKRGP